MLIGILGDTHDHLDNIRRAVRLFNDRGCGLVVHAGDIVSPIALPAFRGLKCRIAAVFGDNDGNREGLLAGFRILGDLAAPPLCVRTPHGRRILVTHRAEELRVERRPDDAPSLSSLDPSGGSRRREQTDCSPERSSGWSSLSYDVVVTSHTHRARIDRRGPTLWINAGEACGWVFGVPTVALYDTDTSQAEIVRLNE